MYIIHLKYNMVWWKLFTSLSENCGNITMEGKPKSVLDLSLLLSNDFKGSPYCIVGHTVLHVVEQFGTLCMTTRNQTKYLRVLSHSWADFCKWVNVDHFRIWFWRCWVGCRYFSRVRFDSSVPCWVRRAQVLLLYFSASVQHVHRHHK